MQDGSGDCPMNIRANGLEFLPDRQRGQERKHLRHRPKSGNRVRRSGRCRSRRKNDSRRWGECMRCQTGRGSHQIYSGGFHGLVSNSPIRSSPEQGPAAHKMRTRFLNVLLGQINLGIRNTRLNISSFNILYRFKNLILKNPLMQSVTNFWTARQRFDAKQGIGC